MRLFFAEVEFGCMMMSRRDNRQDPARPIPAVIAWRAALPHGPSQRQETFDALETL
jgi:hypothetical protein